MPELDELVDQGIMTLRDAGEQMGGFYYHLNEAGIKLMKDIFGNFKEQ